MSFNSQVLCAQAIGFLQGGNLSQAEHLFRQVIVADPFNSTANQMLGVLKAQQGRYAEALELLGVALKVNPRSAQILSNRGNILRVLGRFDEALKSYDQAIGVEPRVALLHNNRGNLLLDLSRFEAAIVSFDNAMVLKSNYAEAYYGRATALLKMKRLEEAIANYDRAILIRSNYVEALYNRGLAFAELELFGDAIASYDMAISFRGKFSEAWNNRGNALRKLKRFEDALFSYQKVLEIKPNFAEGLNNRGIALWHLNKFEDALVSYDAALAIKPDYEQALNNRGTCLGSLKRFGEALADFDRALLIDSNSADALYNRGDILRSLKRFDDALASYEHALNVDPDHPYALGGAASALLNSCGWKGAKTIASNVRNRLKKVVIPPFTFLGYSDDPILQLQCAASYVRDKIPTRERAIWSGTPYRHDKIRVAYLSADFHEHATAFLMAELFEIHDRSRFEVSAFSYGIDDYSEMRTRLTNSFEHFYDVRENSDYEVARMLNAKEIDIAVDLKGHTQDNRLGILSYRPCPVQVSYLGYPGTLGADFIDYVIADRIVAPFDQEAAFAEKIVHLPDSYQVNDSKRPIPDITYARSQLGLPEDGFVFCCFNNSWKIASPIFEIWMRLLDKVPNSVLWLIEDNSGASNRLRDEAASRLISPERLIFAERLPLSGHLARHRVADLFLDTLPYNAHTTASDALWMGLPILTCRGACFAGRVCASLLDAVGLSELITDNLEEYERRALEIACNPDSLATLKRTLGENRRTHPLFDTPRFCRHIESAYSTMIDIAERGEQPRGFNVKPIL
jgi:protein O-GlcNAc transferase